MMVYKGYDCYRNRLTGRFYAVPSLEDFMVNKIVSDSFSGLKAAIDEVVS
jgi:hypothetical protein